MYFEELDQIVVVFGAIVALQFLAAIIGPGALRFVSSLAVLAAAGLAAYTFYLSQVTESPGMAQDGVIHAAQFAAAAVGLLITYYIIRGLFKAMARASVA